MSKLVVDLFAGGGGVSLGIKRALGRSPNVAANHDDDAISMHTINHPETKHYLQDIWAVDPIEATGGQPVGLVWLSPDCTHFSVARGGVPVEKNIRGLAWVQIRWADTVRPDVFCLENVKEFQTWGPLKDDNRPDPKRKGETFRAFVRQIEKQGYNVEWRVLRACDYGAPTRRERFFMVSRCDGLPIVWPTPSHGDPKSLEVQSGRVKPWRTAAEIIDWSIPVPSIFTRKKPLAPNTLRRIARGIRKFVIEAEKPFIVPGGAGFISRIGQTKFGGDKLNYSLDDPLTTVVSKAEHLLVTAFLAKHYGGNYTGAGSDLDEPLHTITAVDHNALVTASLIQYYTETEDGEARGQSLNDPIYTIPTANRFGLVTAHICKFRGHEFGHAADVPLHTITSSGSHHALVQAFLISYYGASIGQDLNDPINTIVSKDRFGLVYIQGTPYQIVDIGMRMLQPHELYAGQGFDSDYIFTHGHDGRKFSKSVQVDKCGNSVPPDLAEAIVSANCSNLSNVAEVV